MELENNVNENKRNLQEYIEKRAKENLIESLQNYVDQVKKNINETQIKLQEDITIDRIEDNIVICELSDGTMLDIPKERFPYEVKEQDVIKVEFIYDQGRQVNLQILEKDEEERLRRIQIMQEKMRQIRRQNN